MLSNITATVAGLVGTYVLFWALLHITQDAREPPTVEDSIPFIGPIIGMMRRGSGFHNYVRGEGP